MKFEEALLSEKMKVWMRDLDGIRWYLEGAGSISREEKMDGWNNVWRVIDRRGEEGNEGKMEEEVTETRLRCIIDTVA